MNASQIITEVLKYMGEVTDTVYFSNNDSNKSRLTVFLNAAVADILEAHNWSALTKSGSITVVQGTTLYNLPTDFNKFVNDTMFQNDTLLNVPVSQTTLVYGENDTYKGRLIGGKLELQNVPPGQVTFRYVSVKPVQSDSGSYKETFTQDSDNWLLDDELIIRATRHRYALQTGDESAGMAASDVQNRMKAMISKDVGARRFKVGEYHNTHLQSPYVRGT